MITGGTFRVTGQHIELDRCISSVRNLPRQENVFRQLVCELSSGQGSIARIGTLIGCDVGMTAKILQIANSAAFGVRQSVYCPRAAVSMLGIESLRNLVLQSGIFGVRNCVADNTFSVYHFSVYANRVARLAGKTAMHQTGD